ncbi:MAG: hypothetical protein JXD22_09065 [Sedimentisphaerales bacterium]|nr:hypothetical protein [Sedimentisphaerales bacterium]
MSILILSAFSYAAEKTGEVILIPNGSFDRTDNGDPVGWEKTTWSGKARLEYSSDGHNDNGCVKISSDEGADAGWTTQVEVKPFHKYKLLGWIKTENFLQHTGKGALINIHGNMDFRTNAITENADWTKVEMEFTAESDMIQINCLFGGWGQSKGTALYDDVQLIFMGEPAPPESKTVESTVSIDTNVTFEPISKYIYGQFIEHLGKCIYGGIWAEMLEDRKFYYAVPAQGKTWGTTDAGARVLRDSPWKVIGPETSVKMSEKIAYSGEHSPEITVTGQPTGIYQQELALVKGRKYQGHVVIAGDKGSLPVEVSLVWGKEKNDRETVKITRFKKDFTKVTFDFTAGGDTDNGTLEIVSRGNGSFAVGAVSLMPADNIEGFRADTLALLKKLDSPVYRWPGGNFVSGYDWRDGLGERDQRPTRANPAWTGIETNDVGMDEFVRLCQLIDAEPMIAVNTGFGDAYSAAAEVEYANGSSKTFYGKKRAENGNNKPYKVKWWCVGNEMYGGWQLGYMKLEHYVLKHNQVVEKMQQVDPTIKTIGVGSVGDWSRGMLVSCSDNMDLLSEHFYCLGRTDVAQHVRQIPNNIKHIADAHRQYRKTINSIKGKDIRIALDEWNYWYGKHVYGELGTRYFLNDALGIAAGLHEYFRNSDIYFMANYAQTVNVIGCIKTTKTEAGFATTALPLMLYRKEFGTIPVKVGDAGNDLDVAAALTKDKRSLTVAVVNPTWNTCKLTFDLEGIRSSDKAKTWVIAGDNPFLYNTPGQEEKVSIKAAESTDLSKEVTLKPLSITMYKVSLR